MTNASEAALQFRAAMQADGLDPGHLPITDDQFHHFRAPEARVGDRSAWYKCNTTRGIYGCLRWGLSKAWTNGIKSLSKKDQEKINAEIEAAQAEAETEKKRREEKAAAEAEFLWKSTIEIEDPCDHSYLTKKQILAHGIRRLGVVTLCVPMRQVTTGRIVNIQKIHPITGKRFLFGGQVLGTYYPIAGDENAHAICVAEGYATAATIAQATGYPVAVAFSGANLAIVAKALHRKYPRHTIILCADDDRGLENNPGVTKATEAARAANGVVAIPEFPPEADKNKTDFNDLACMLGAEAVRDLIDAAVEQAKQIRRRPIIFIQPGKRPWTIDDAEKAILRDFARWGVYRYGDQLVHVSSWSAEDQKRAAHGIRRPVGAPVLTIPTPPLMDDILGRAISWLAFNANTDEWLPTDTPRHISAQYLARVGDWKLPYLNGVVSGPVVRPNNSILTKPGYDEATGLLLASTIPWIPPTDLTQNAAKRAAETLRKPFSEFNFSHPAAMSVVVSAILTGVQRRLLLTAPAHAFDANHWGAGKTLLADCVSIIVTGAEPAIITAREDDEPELEKALLSVLIAGDQVVVIDNITWPLESAAFAAILTHREFQGRILGLSKHAKVLTNCLFLETGNNLTFSGDMPRRQLFARIEVKDENPDQRTGFKIPDLKDYCYKHRQTLIDSALTIIAAYAAAGRPNRLPALGSFEHWSDEIRSAITWAGFADPCETRGVIDDMDPERESTTTLFYHWFEHFRDKQIYVRELTEAANVPITHDDKFVAWLNPDLRAAVLEVAGTKGRIDPQQLGLWCRARKDRVVVSDNKRYQLKRGERGRNGARWMVKCADVEHQLEVQE